jgi:Fic family protein
MPEKGEISLHEVKIYRTFTNSPSSWFTNKEIATATGVAQRTVRLHTFRLVQLGILDLAEVFPAHKFRFAKAADKRNKGYFLRLETACDVFSW